MLCDTRCMDPPRYTTDTSAEAEAVQLEILRQMSPQERVQRMCTLSHQLRCMAFDAIRRTHPQMSESDVKLKFIEVTYGKELADEVRSWLENVP